MSRADTARAILGIPLYDELMSELESTAINAAVNAPPTDHETRQAQMAEVRAIRNLRSRVEVISREDHPTERKQAPA